MKRIRITFNSPVVLSFALISLGALVVGRISNGLTTLYLFSTWRSGILDPLMYVRIFTHVLGHADFAHYFGNMMIFLLLGPMLEEKYGSRNILEMIAFTALISGLVNNLLFPDVALLGASGICFMFIILSSITSVSEGEIPLTFILIMVMYLGNEVYAGLFSVDNVSQLAHIIGGLCGAIFGLVLNKSFVKR